jgi:hypothetical protein
MCHRPRRLRSTNPLHNAGLAFQPSDRDPEARASIDGWVKVLGLRNVRAAIDLDAGAAHWPIDKADAVICINMIHIAPWEAAVGLARGAAAVLDAGGLLVLYDPFREGGRHTAPSNAPIPPSPPTPRPGTSACLSLAVSPPRRGALLACPSTSP